MTIIKSITIGKLTFSKKAILAICFGAFYLGFILGILVFVKIKTGSNYAMFAPLLFVPIWILLKPILKKEVTEIN